MSVTLTIKFADEEDLRGWAESARTEGFLNEDAGIRHADALDGGSKGRAHPGEFIVADEPGAGGDWLLPPENGGGS